MIRDAIRGWFRRVGEVDGSRRAVLQGLLLGGGVAGATAAGAEFTSNGDLNTHATPRPRIIPLGSINLAASGWGVLSVPVGISGVRLVHELKNDRDVHFACVTVGSTVIAGTAHPEIVERDGSYYGPGPRKPVPTAAIELLAEVELNQDVWEDDEIRVSLYNADCGSGHLVSGTVEIEVGYA